MEWLQRAFGGGGGGGREGGEPDILGAVGARVCMGADTGANVRALAAAQRQALQEHGQQIEAAPQAFAPVVERFAVEMGRAERNLSEIERLVNELDNLASRNRDPAGKRTVKQARTLFLEARAQFKGLAKGFWSGARRVDGTQQFGAWQAVLIVAGVVVSIAAIAWAIVGYQDARSLADKTQYQREELAARIEAMRAGTTLQPSTVQKDNLPIGEIVIGAVASAAAGVLLAEVWRKQKKQ